MFVTVVKRVYFKKTPQNYENFCIYQNFALTLRKIYSFYRQ